jgi:tetratricopeptide (TPR) repeat protein
MALVPVNCTQCGAAIQIPDEVDKANCMYCGTVLMVKETIKKNQSDGPDASKLIDLGNTSLEAGRSEEAYNYFTRAIEADSTSAAAWFGKAESSWGMATLKDIRNKEIILCCEKYVELSENKSAAATKASDLLTRAARGISSASFEYFTEYGGTYVGQMGSAMAVTSEEESQVWIGRLYSTALMHTKAVDIAETANINLVPVLVAYLDTLNEFVQNAFFVQKIQCHAETTDGRRINSHSYNVLLRGVDDDDRNRLFSAYETNRAKLLSVEATYAEKYKSTDEILKAQNDKASSSGLCFVATACYGSESDESVVILREFRDKFLRKHILGEKFIKFYYGYGAYAAIFIRDNRPLLILVRRLICDPAAVLAKIYLKSRG